MTHVLAVLGLVAAAQTQEDDLRKLKEAAAKEQADAAANGHAQQPAGEPEKKSQAAQASAMQDVKNKWDLTLYGFAELDMIWDNTQSFTDFPGNTSIAKPNTFAGSHDRWTMGARNSRIGVRVAAPEWNGIKATAVIESDFMNNQTPGGGFGSEKAFFVDPTFRYRHAYLKLQTPVVDILFGQYWNLFGWQSTYHPASVEIQGVLGQVYSRNPQLRVSKLLGSDTFGVEMAVAASRSIERDTGTPDGQAGLKFIFGSTKALHTMGGAGTAEDPMSIGVSGILRSFTPPFPFANENGWGVSIDLLLPIVSGSLKDRGGALTVTASYVYGEGIADAYSGLNGGFPLPGALFNPFGGGDPTVDKGLVTRDTATSIRAIPWQSAIVGVQYYLPPSGEVWIALDYSFVNSYNGDFLANAVLGNGGANVWTYGQWASANLFWDITPAVRLGVCYSFFWQKYTDGTNAVDSHVGLAAWYIF